MIKIGYALSSEEFTPIELIQYAQEAEHSGFTFSLISDHFHPWINQQNHSPFVWSVLGALARATTQMRLGTAVTCPTFRIHPHYCSGCRDYRGDDAGALLPWTGQRRISQ